MTQPHNPDPKTNPAAASQPDQSAPPIRKRGAQLGNKNAVKYGFYAKKTMRRLNYDPYINDPQLLINEFEKLKQVMHGMFASITPESSMKDMLFTCRLLFHTTTAFSHLTHVVNHPAKHLCPSGYSEPKGEELIQRQDPMVYDWDASSPFSTNSSSTIRIPNFRPRLSPLPAGQRIEPPCCL